MPAKNVVKTRTLADLYQTGKELTLDDGNGPITVWLQKLNPVETETAARKANAVRTARLLERKDKESEAYIAALGDLLELSHDDLFSFAVNDETARRSPALEAEYASNDEWSKDDYLQGLYDAWEEGGLKELYHSTEEGEAADPEALRVYNEIERYENRVAELIMEERARVDEELTNKPDDELRDIMLQKLMRTQADISWMIEFRKSEVWQGTRRPDDHEARYFDKRSTVDTLHPKILNALVDAFAELNVEVEQGKDSQPPEDSS